MAGVFHRGRSKAAPYEGCRVYCNATQAKAWEPVGFWSRLRPDGPWELSPGFSLGGVIFCALAL